MIKIRTILGSSRSSPIQPMLLLPHEQTITNPSRISFQICAFRHRKSLVGVQGYGTSPSSSYSVTEDAGFEVLVCENGWRVRRMIEEQNEMRKVARVQAEAFHEPVFFMDDLFFQFFQVSDLYLSKNFTFHQCSLQNADF